MKARVDLDKLQRTLAEAAVLIEASGKGGPAAALAGQRALEAMRAACRISARMEADGAWAALQAASVKPPATRKVRGGWELRSCEESRQALRRLVGEDTVAAIVSLSPSPSRIVAAVATASGIGADKICSKTQIPPVVVARHLSMLLMRAIISARLREIACCLGQADNYSGPSYGVAAAASRLIADPDGETATLARAALGRLTSDMTRLADDVTVTALARAA